MADLDRFLSGFEVGRLLRQTFTGEGRRLAEEERQQRALEIERQELVLKNLKNEARLRELQVEQAPTRFAREGQAFESSQQTQQLNQALARFNAQLNLRGAALSEAQSQQGLPGEFVTQHVPGTEPGVQIPVSVQEQMFREFPLPEVQGDPALGVGGIPAGSASIPTAAFERLREQEEMLLALSRLEAEEDIRAQIRREHEDPFQLFQSGRHVGRVRRRGAGELEITGSFPAEPGRPERDPAHVPTEQELASARRFFESTVEPNLLRNEKTNLSGFPARMRTAILEIAIEKGINTQQAFGDSALDALRERIERLSLTP